MTGGTVYESVAGGCSTIGKLPLNVRGHPIPARAVRARGATFTDEDGIVWTDFDMALGSVVWGHGREEFAVGIRDALLECGSASVPTVREHAAASCLLDRLERYDQLRFFKTGADACSAAVRIARASTRRSLVAVDGYHGWHDWSAAWAYPNSDNMSGILKAVKRASVPLDPAAGLPLAHQVLLPIADRVAAVVVRPEAWSAEALAEISALCRTRGAVLVFDEVTSHFKYGRTGTAGARGVWPDLLCISKGLANGLPLAALLGSERLMRHATTAHISSTYASESTALAALMIGEGLLAASSEWPSWRRELASVEQSVRATIGHLGLTGVMHTVPHPGFFSIERAAIPFKTDPLRLHIVASLADRGLFSRGWFHGSDQHTTEHWNALRQALESALETWAERG